MTSPAIVIFNRAGKASLGTDFRAANLGAADPFGHVREIAWSGPTDMAVGRVSFSGSFDTGSFPHTEAIIVVAGSLAISVKGGPATVIAAGSGLVVGRGTALRLDATAGTRWIFCALTEGSASLRPGVERLSASATLLRSMPPAPEVLIGPAPECRSFNAFTDEAAGLRAGTWDSTPYRRIVRPHRVNELMHIVEGSVDLTGEDGSVTTVSKGDTVFVVQGAACAWESRVHVAKFYGRAGDWRLTSMLRHFIPQGAMHA